MIWKRDNRTLSNRGLVTGSHELYRGHHDFCILLSLTLYFALSTFCKRNTIISALRFGRWYKNMNNIWKRTVPGAVWHRKCWYSMPCIYKAHRSSPLWGFFTPSLAGTYGVSGPFSDTCWGFQTLREPTAWPLEQYDYLTCTQGQVTVGKQDRGGLEKNSHLSFRNYRGLMVSGLWTSAIFPKNLMDDENFTFRMSSMWLEFYQNQGSK